MVFVFTRIGKEKECWFFWFSATGGLIHHGGHNLCDFASLRDKQLIFLFSRKFKRKKHADFFAAYRLCEKKNSVEWFNPPLRTCAPGCIGTYLLWFVFPRFTYLRQVNLGLFKVWPAAAGRVIFVFLRNIDCIKQDPQLRMQPCIAMGEAHGFECE